MSRVFIVAGAPAEGVARTEQQRGSMIRRFRFMWI